MSFKNPCLSNVFYHLLLSILYEEQFFLNFPFQPVYLKMCIFLNTPLSSILLPAAILRQIYLELGHFFEFIFNYLVQSLHTSPIKSPLATLWSSLSPSSASLRGQRHLYGPKYASVMLGLGFVWFPSRSFLKKLHFHASYPRFIFNAGKEVTGLGDIRPTK